MKTTLIIVSILSILIAPFFGNIDIDTNNLLNPNTIDYKIFWDIRVPRVILAFFIGGILALSGLVFQSVFRNPMSTPFTLGVASGATLFGAIGVILGLAMFIHLFAFFGALLTIVILFAISSRLKAISTSSLLLVGIALSFFYSACMMIVFYLSDLSQSYQIVRFTMGSLDIVGYTNIYIISIVGVSLLLFILSFKNKIKLLLISYEFAYLKGLDIKKTNYLLLLVVSIATGVSVSITGPIGFVGLIVPHIIKTIYQTSSEKLIVPIFYYGGIFLVVSDIIARNISTSDIPIGVVTSFIGAPFFIYLIIKRKSL
jgi:iron complex transport system permease protein